jgi:hypothetical protein
MWGARWGHNYGYHCWFISQKSGLELESKLKPKLKIQKEVDQCRRGSEPTHNSGIIGTLLQISEWCGQIDDSDSRLSGNQLPFQTVARHS